MLYTNTSVASTNVFTNGGYTSVNGVAGRPMNATVNTFPAHVAAQAGTTQARVIV